MLFRLGNSEWTVTCSPLRDFLNSDVVKRALDTCLALTALIGFSPILVICALAIRLGSAQNVLFRQERVGRHGCIFKVIKLTTMKDEAHLTGPKLSLKRDPRVTRLGHAIRAFGFNELPQFINVLKGEMSIVGPRPEVPEYVKHWPGDSRDRILAVRPGITGLATVQFWHESSLLDAEDDVERVYLEDILPQKLRTELSYVAQHTLWLDLRIMAITLKKALGGSRHFRSGHDPKQIPPQEVRL